MIDSKAIARELAKEFGEQHGFPGEQVLGLSRKKGLIEARRAMYEAARARHGWGVSEIARAFGRDHATIINALQKSAPEHHGARARWFGDHYRCVKCGCLVQPGRAA
jgi:chromosomal replication initiation ATPase DnaA